MSKEVGKSKTSASNAFAFARQAILILVFLSVVAAGVYEYSVARPTFNGLAIRLNELAETPEGIAYNTSNEGVQKYLDAVPATVEKLGEDSVLLEKYSVRRGLPFATYDLYVWYQQGPKKDKWLYAGHRPKDRPTKKELPRRVGQDVVISTSKDLVIEITGGEGTQRPNPYEVPTENVDEKTQPSDAANGKSITDPDSAE